MPENISNMESNWSEVKEKYPYVLYPIALHRVLTVLSAMGLCMGIPKTINIPFVSNGKLMVLRVPIVKHIMIIDNKIINKQFHSIRSTSRYGPSGIQL